MKKKYVEKALNWSKAEPKKRRHTKREKTKEVVAVGVASPNHHRTMPTLRADFTLRVDVLADSPSYSSIP